MKYTNLQEAINEAFRFIEKSLELKDQMEEKGLDVAPGGKSKNSQLSGSVKRASMDLSRALVKLRGR